MVFSSMRGISSSRWACRSDELANRASSRTFSSPSAAQSAAHVFGVTAPSVSHPSALRTAWYGASLWWAEPSGRPISPVAKKRPASQTASETADSSSDTSMYCPAPLRSRSRSAATTPSATYKPQTRSHTGTPTFAGGPPGAAGDAHQAAAGLRHDVEPGPIGERSILAEPRRRGIDDARVHRPHVVVGQPERPHRTGAQVLDDDVRGLREPQERAFSFRRLEIQRDRTLRAIQAQER